jgi:hypothetical protein
LEKQRQRDEADHAADNQFLESALGWNKPGQEGLENRLESLKIHAGQQGLTLNGQPVEKTSTLANLAAGYYRGASSVRNQVETLDAMMRENFGVAWDILTFPRHVSDSLARLALRFAMPIPSVKQPALPDPGYVDERHLINPKHDTLTRSWSDCHRVRFRSDYR